MRIKTNFVKIINLIRINDWSYNFGVPLLGYFFVLDSNSFSYFDLIMLLVLTFFIFSFSYSYDVYSDVLKYRKSEKYPHIKRSLQFSGIFLVVSLIISFLISFFIFSLVVIINALVLLYYKNPFRLKSRAGINTLVNAVCWGMLFLIGASISRFELASFYPAILMFIGTVTSQLVHEISDFRKDLKSKISTTAIKLGEKRTKILIYISLFLMVLWSIFIVYELDLSLNIFLITLLYAFIAGFVLKLSKYRNVRIRLRILLIIYWSLILILFYFRL